MAFITVRNCCLVGESEIVNFCILIFQMKARDYEKVEKVMSVCLYIHCCHV